MRNCYNSDYLKSYLPAKPANFIFSFFKSGYTCTRDFRYIIASRLLNDWSWCVEEKTKALDS